MAPFPRRKANLTNGTYFTRPPPPPPFLARFAARRYFWGGGVCFEPPRGWNFICPPLFYTTPRRVFSGVVGEGVYKIWPSSVCVCVRAHAFALARAHSLARGSSRALARVRMLALARASECLCAWRASARVLLFLVTGQSRKQLITS